MAERRGQVAVKDLPPKLQKKLRRQKIMPKKARKLNRSMAGNALLPGESARLAPTTFEQWLSRQQ